MEPTELIWAVFGVCTVGFFFLANWIRSITDKAIVEELREIKKSLIGDLKDINRPAIIPELQNQNRRITSIEARCKEIHPK